MIAQIYQLHVGLFSVQYYRSAQYDLFLKTIFIFKNNSATAKDKLAYSKLWRFSIVLMRTVLI